MENEERSGVLSAFTCPECKGPLWELYEGKLIRFRCRQGHAFTADTMLNGQAEAVEDALWTAVLGNGEQEEPAALPITGEEEQQMKQA